MSENQLNNLALLKYFFSPETKNLTASERLTALCLAQHRNNISMLCCPSLNTIKKETAMAKKTIIKAIKNLVEKNKIVKLKIKRLDSKFMNNQYYFLYDIKLAKIIYNDIDSIFYRNHEDQVKYFEKCIILGLF